MNAPGRVDDHDGGLRSAAVAAAVALSGLPGMTAVRLRLLLRRHHPLAALEVAAGRRPDPVVRQHLDQGRTGAATWFDRWAGALARHRPEAALARCEAAGVEVTLLGEAAYPACLASDPEAPAVLFHRGDLGVLEGRRVGVVGTRSATLTGRRTATELGVRLAERGVRVVSGLARGIDGAVHRGVLAVVGGGPPVGVVASGLDVVYPLEHRDLWHRVATEGVLLSEYPPGTAPRAAAFPERNRILAALSELVVVVESRHQGGSLHTVREATKRDITVMAVPGSVGSRASEGTNALLQAGALMALDATDVLVALGLDTRRAHGRRYDPRPLPSAPERELLDLMGADAASLEELVLRSGLDLGEVALLLGRLEGAGWVGRSGPWFEVLPAPDPPSLGAR